ncbi:MAG: hypothetical protein JO317_01275 [Verrucomicrobiae bacterium]|nr:hypothetical protein [Verrucomicrobiae bacterium]
MTHTHSLPRLGALWAWVAAGLVGIDALLASRYGFGVGSLAALALLGLFIAAAGWRILPPPSEDGYGVGAALVALMIAGACAWAAWSVDAFFAAPALLAWAWAGAALMGVISDWRVCTPLAWVLFAVPWMDPATSPWSYPWRRLLADCAGALGRVFVGTIHVDGTLLSGDSFQLAIGPGSDGLWEVQVFLLSCAALAIGARWRVSRWIAWMLAGILCGWVAYLGFLVSAIALQELSGHGLTGPLAAALELAWWIAAFAMMALAIRNSLPRSGGRVSEWLPPAHAEGSGAGAGVREKMFEENFSTAAKPRSTSAGATASTARPPRALPSPPPTEAAAAPSR